MLNIFICAALVFIFVKVLIGVFQKNQIRYTDSDSSAMDHLMDDEELHELYMNNEQKYKEELILSKMEIQFSDKKKYHL